MNSFVEGVGFTKVSLKCVNECGVERRSLKRIDFLVFIRLII